MQRSLIAGNWKMNGSKKKLSDLAEQLFSLECDADVVIFPPNVYICDAVEAFSGASIAVGAQDVSENSRGAYTGEISSEMLIDIGCEYCIVGHSERRSLFGEDNLKIAGKFYQASEAGLIPILCLGETFNQREKDETLDVITDQLNAVVEYTGKVLSSDLVIAYEPVWAIGSGKSASTDQIKIVHQYIRRKLQEKGLSARILYGGSVTPENTKELLEESDIDGLLVGGASLDAKSFVQICRLA
jgi:triosephosphate isomerase